MHKSHCAWSSLWEPKPLFKSWSPSIIGTMSSESPTDVTRVQLFSLSYFFCYHFNFDRATVLTILCCSFNRYIAVDIYGKGGWLSCPRGRDEDECWRMLLTTYKFYLAFENSNCWDYMTEKLFINSLRYTGTLDIAFRPAADGAYCMHYSTRIYSGLRDRTCQRKYK